jgi:GNAT superfamily N-acetyltransferase
MPLSRARNSSGAIPINHLITQLPNHQISDLLERHEETSNAEVARRIGGETWERGDALVISSRQELGSGLNFACRVRSDDAAVESLIDDVSGWLARRGVAPHFRISPLTQPATLAQLLAARGFVQTEAETQMVLAAADIEPETNPSVTIERADANELTRWATIQHLGFGGQGAPSELMLEMARTISATHGNTLYLARLEGEPVGAGVLTEWAGALGIYGVATLLKARGHGVGTALVRRMKQDARPDLPLCLQAETGSGTQHWYERLGFRVAYDRTGWTRKSAS